MPTYQLRSNTIGHHTEQGVCVFSATQEIETEKVLTEATLTFTDASGYVLGETITETTSATTGVIAWKTSTTLGVISVSDVFTGGEVITGGTSGTTETPVSVQNLLEQTAATPTGTLLAAAQDLTANFANCGAEIVTEGNDSVRLWVDLDINDSTDVRFKVIGRYTRYGAMDATYDALKWSLRDSTLSAAEDYRELDTDADGKFLIEIECDHAMPVLQLQVCAGTVGATAGQIDALYVVRG